MSCRRAAALALVVVASCGGGGAPVVGAKDLGGVVAASVGGDPIPVAAVERVARAQNVAPVRARDLLIDDAVLAAGARARGIDPWFELDAALARRLSKSLIAEAEARGPVTDAELAEGTKRYWLDVDRPAATRVAQVIFLLSAAAKPEDKAEAQRVGEALRDKVIALHDLAARTTPPKVSFHDWKSAELDELAQAYQEIARVFPSGHAQLQWEVEPPIADDNRMLEDLPPDQPVEESVPEFTKELALLHERGDVRLFSTRFGVHVVMLLEKTPAALFSPEERRKKLLDITIKDRARAAELELLAKLRAQASIERHAEGMLADVVVSQ